MEAHSLKLPAAAGFAFALSLLATVHAAEFRTTNFVVSAPTAEIARQVGETAEKCRVDLAQEWLGRTLPNWYRPCPIKVQVGQMGAGGATTFTFDRGEVSGWNMRVQGTLERVLDSVIPHEVSHTIFASHFRRPLPRWADEGAATLIEHPDERKRQEVLLERVIHTTQRIPLDRLLAMSEYPTDMQQVYTLYAEGYSLANFLVQQHGPEGKAIYLQFLQDAHEQGWKPAIEKHYQFASIGDLERKWTGWVLAGSPSRQRQAGDSLVASAQPTSSAGSPAVTDGRLAMVAAPVLPPLAPLARGLRPTRTETVLSAPAPAAVRVAALDDMTSDRAVADGRVAPRVSPFPGLDFAARRRMEQIRQESAAAARRGEQLAAQQVNTARTADPTTDAVLRGQSGEQRHWGEFSGYPQASGSDPATDAHGRRIPFAN